MPGTDRDDHWQRPEPVDPREEIEKIKAKLDEINERLGNLLSKQHGA